MLQIRRYADLAFIISINALILFIIIGYRPGTIVRVISLAYRTLNELFPEDLDIKFQ